MFAVNALHCAAMRLVQRPSWLLLSVLLAILALECDGQRRHQRSSAALFSGEPSADGPVTPAAGSLRDSLQEVRLQLRQPHITRSQRRQLKSRKRRLREELRVQRAQRRRERRKRRRQRARGRLHPAVAAPELQTEQAATGGLSERASRPAPATVPDSFIDADEMPTERGGADGATAGLDGPLAGHSDGLGDAEDPAALAVSEEEAAAGAQGGGGLFSSLWDWVAPPEDGEELEEEEDTEESPEPEQDDGWTVPPLPPGRQPNIVIIMTDDLDVELGESYRLCTDCCTVTESGGIYSQLYRYRNYPFT